MIGARMFSPLVVVGALLALAPAASAQPRGSQPSARLQLESRQAYAGVPFSLALVVDGFDEQPAPALPTLTVPGAVVTPLGASPNVSRSVRIMNGQRYDSVEVTWVLRWRLDVDAAGTLQVPPLTVVQGGTQVQTAGAQLEVRALPTTADMKLELELPERPVWVGEPFPVHIDWLLRRNPDDPSFSVPLLAMEDALTITPPSATDAGKTITFPAGGRDLELPYVRDQVDRAGVEYTRLRFTVTATPRRAGTLEVAPSSVAAGLAVGRPDVFGNASVRQFRVTDVARTIEVRPLPQTDRPASFAGAVGEGFALEVRASRSVVSLGEPVELEITVRGETGLDVLGLPRLDGAGGLPTDLFTVPTDPPLGELSADGTRKVFRVPVQVTGPATEIPALALSYFDPVKASYQTVHSEPIALSVKAGGVGDRRRRRGRGDAVADGGRGRQAAASLLGTDLQLALSAPGDAGAAPLGGATLDPRRHPLPGAAGDLRRARVAAPHRQRSRRGRRGARRAPAPGRRAGPGRDQPARDRAGPGRWARRCARWRVPLATPSTTMPRCAGCSRGSTPRRSRRRQRARRCRRSCARR
ncbi:MAG: BatD family protein [Kofleriaceae bacterium]